MRKKAKGKRYSEVFKRQVVRDIERGKMTPAEVARKYGITGAMTIARRVGKSIPAGQVLGPIWIEAWVAKGALVLLVLQIPLSPREGNWVFQGERVLEGSFFDTRSPLLQKVAWPV
jgi:hypothetical protein